MKSLQAVSGGDKLSRASSPAPPVAASSHSPPGISFVSDPMDTSVATGASQPASVPAPLQPASNHTPGIQSISVPGDTSVPPGVSPPASASSPLLPAPNHNPTGTGLAGSTTALSNVMSGSSIAAGAHVFGGQSSSSNPQSPTAPVPAKSEAFKKAVQEFVDSLSYEDKAAFQSPSDIMERLQAMQNCQNSRVSSSLTTRVQDVLQCVKNFLGSISILIQSNPEIASLVVGGINCILTVSMVVLCVCK